MGSFGNIGGGPSDNYFGRSGPGFGIGGGLNSGRFGFGYFKDPSS